MPSLHLDRCNLQAVPQQVLIDKCLNRIWLSNNLLTYLPVEFKTLSNLENLWLNNNNFRCLSSVPDNIKTLCVSCNPLRELHITNCLSLTELLANDCKFSEFPKIHDLPVLRHLELHANNVTFIPRWIGQLQCLEHISLHSNQLETIPDELGSLKNLKWLSLHANNLTSLPPSIGNLTKLERLSLHYNSLTCLPEELGNLKNIQVMSLFHNKLTSIPGSLCKGLESCKKLALHDNLIECIPEEIVFMMSLEELWIYDNPLCHKPNTTLKLLSNIPNLQKIHVGKDQDVVPSDIKEKIAVNKKVLHSNRAFRDLYWKILLPYAYKRLNICDEAHVNEAFLENVDCIAKNVSIKLFIELLDESEKSCFELIRRLPQTCNILTTRIRHDLQGNDYHLEDWVFMLAGCWVIPIKRISEFQDPASVLFIIMKLGT